MLVWKTAATSCILSLLSRCAQAFAVSNQAGFGHRLIPMLLTHRCGACTRSSHFVALYYWQIHGSMHLYLLSTSQRTAGIANLPADCDIKTRPNFDVNADQCAEELPQEKTGMLLITYKYQLKTRPHQAEEAMILLVHKSILFARHFRKIQGSN